MTFFLETAIAHTSLTRASGAQLRVASWPASIALAQWLAAAPDAPRPTAVESRAAAPGTPRPPPLRVLELGAGIGLPGLSLAARGGGDGGVALTLSDLDASSAREGPTQLVSNLVHNAAANGLDGAAPCCCVSHALDWTDRKTWLPPQSFNLVLGADVLYYPALTEVCACRCVGVNGGACREYVGVGVLR